MSDRPGKRSSGGTSAIVGRVWRGAVGLVVAFIVVDLVVRIGLVDRETFPAPGAIVARAGELLADTSFWPEIWTTLRGALIGLAIATIAGVVLGALITSSRVADRLLVIPIELIRPLPAVALAPLLLAIFGRGITSRSLAVAFAAMWPILFNTIAGLRALPSTGDESARAMGLDRWQRLVRVRLPAALPFVFTGVRVAASIAVIVQVSVEILLPDSNQAGLGGFIALNSIAGFGLDDREAVYAATLISGLVGLVIAQSLGAVDRRWFAWARRGRS